MYVGIGEGGGEGSGVGERDRDTTVSRDEVRERIPHWPDQVRGPPLSLPLFSIPSVVVLAIRREVMVQKLERHTEKLEHHNLS